MGQAILARAAEKFSVLTQAQIYTLHRREKKKKCELGDLSNMGAPVT